MATKFKNGIDLGSQKITSVADPATTTDAATKNYVDTQDALNAKLASANTFTNTNLVKLDSLTAFRIQNNAGTVTLFGADTTANKLSVTTVNANEVSSGGVSTTPILQVTDSGGSTSLEIRSTLGGASTPNYNISIGTTSGSKITTGSGNTAVGHTSNTAVTTGNYNTALGYQANNAVTATSHNTAVGYQANRAITGSSNAAQNTSVGSLAHYTATASNSVAAFGYAANYYPTGSQNTSVGAFAGYLASGSAGSQNTFVGYNSAYHTGQLLSPTNSIAIGASAFVTASNQAVIGNASVTETRLQAPNVYGTATSLNALSAPTISSTSTAATGGTLAQNTTYYYVMTAINAAGTETVAGTESSRTTGNTTATNTITINWTAVPGATSYRIYRSTTTGSYTSAGYYSVTTASFSGGNASATPSLSYTDTNATVTGNATPPTAPTPTSQLTVNGWNTQTTNANVVVKAGTSQAANLQEWQNSSGTVVSSIGPSGSPTFTGTTTVQAASTQDAIKIAGRAGGSSSYAVTVTPTTLTANRTLTAPDAGGTIAVSDSAIDNNRAGFFIAPQGTALGTNLTIGANGTMYGVRYTMPRTITTPTTFVLYCVTGISGGVQTGVIYNSAGSSIICTTTGNSWTSASTGIKTVAFSTANSLVAGLSYWFTVWFSNQVTVSGLTGYNGFFGTSVTNAEVCTQTSLLAAPSDLSAASFTAGPGYAPILGVRGS